MVDKAFYESLPKKRMGAGCIFFNQKGDVMLLKPTYKEGWEIPGGVVEENESPKACCEREIQEEIGLDIKVGGLLVIDYNSYPDESYKTESLMFIFDGGVLSDMELSKMQLAADEIGGYACFSVEDLPTNMNHSLRNRLIQAVQQKQQRSCGYLENQEIV